MAAQIILAALQPYPGRNQALALLRTLHDRYQEQALELTLVVVTDVRLRWKRACTTVYESILPASEAKHRRLLSEDAVQGLPLPLDLDVRGTAMTYLAFADESAAPLSQPLAVVDTLDALTEYVSGIVVPAFEQFL